MKSKALYHLMMDRARHIRTHGKADIAQFLSDVEDSLTVDFDRGLYLISWIYHNQSHEIEMRDADFRFYIRGDLGKPVTIRDVRRGNWEAALDMWRKIADASGQRWPTEVEAHQESMGLDIAPRDPVFPLIKRFATVALAAYAGGLIMGGMGLACASMLTALSLTLFSHHRTGLRKAPWSAKVNDAIITLGAVMVPPFFDEVRIMPLSMVLFMGLVLYLIETYRPHSKWHWLTAGGLIGLIAWITQSAGLSYGLIVFAAFFAFVATFMPVRFDLKALYGSMGLIALGALLGLGLVVSPALAISPFIWLLIAIFAIVAGTGWFIGELFTLLPWLINALIGFIALATAITGDAAMAGACTIASGFAFVEFGRMINAYRGSQAAPIIRHGDAA